MHEENELYKILGEISSDVKHVLIRQEKQDKRLDRMHARVVTVEKFQWKLMGIAAATPIVASVVGLFYTILPQ